MKIFAQHHQEGYSEYDSELWDKIVTRLENHITRMCKDGFIPIVNDVIELWEDESDEFNEYISDSYYYEVRHRTIQYRKGELIVTFWLDDYKYKE